MTGCIFCKIASKQIPANVVYEDKMTLAFLDIHPVNPGHTLVIPKEHAPTLLESSRESAHAVVDTVQKITPAILAAVGSPAFNLGVNTGSAAGQAVHHFHLHIMPRFDADGRELWHGRETVPGELEAVAAKIKERLE
ncbi:HIT family protein [Patescibacteria group bacterium]|nr:MAG: HIT family protein [Patescibacteria group bacterium]